MRPTILTFGEIIWDIYDNEQVIGGAAFNFASHCSKCGSYSALFSAVGQDDLGIKALEYAKEANDVDYIERINEQLEMIKTVL